VRGEGTVIGELSLLADTTRTATVRATRETKLSSFPREALVHLLETSPSASMKMLDTVIERLRSNELMLRQSERMAQLGELTAGIAHELNNPAAAVRRGAEQLRTALAWSQRAQREAERLGIHESVMEAISGFVEEKFAHQTPITNEDPITRADQITELEEQLEQYGVPNSWEVAPELIDMGADLREVEKLLPGASPEVYASAIDWLAASFSVRSILKGIEQGADQIAEIVKALKAYSYMDQAPSQLIDVHEGLDNTLIMLRHLWKKGIVIERKYDAELPRILAYGSELNQVWTNILANAIEAMEGRGKITITTTSVDGGVRVEIEDSGPGIPPEEQPKIFGLFHTTKPVGKGTGLGLNISYRIVQKHGGKISFESEPGRTVFVVWVPGTGHGR
jgi:signal transduction histidine kinase